MSGSIYVDRDVPMEMRDGTVLRADIFRPNDKQKCPALLQRTRVNKVRMASSGEYIDVIQVVEAGYAVVFQDQRGRFASDGEWSPVSEGKDGYDSVEWLAGQPWCDGNIGMFGGSHMAGAQWQTASEIPPHLKAIAPALSGGSVLGPEVTGGVMSLSQAIATINDYPDVADRLEKQGKDVTEMRRAIEWALKSPESVYNFLPLKDVPFAKFKPLDQLWAARLNPVIMTRSDSYYEKVTVAGFHIFGWYDALGGFDGFNNMREKGHTKAIKESQHVFAGPWLHGGPAATLGAINFGTSAGPAINSGGAQMVERQIAFFDRYLKGKNIKIPTVRYFLMGMNQWQESDVWPLPNTQWQRFYLHSRGNANTGAGNGALSREEPGSESPDVFIYNPHFPVPTIGSRALAVAGVVAGPLDQSLIEKRSDVLCYTSQELDEDLEITGDPIEIHLFTSTSARDTDFTAKLIDVYPDGRAYNLVEGIKRARGLKSALKPELINPGQVYEYIIKLGKTSNLFRKGHRIRVDISSSNFPMFDRNMNTGNATGEDAKGIPAMQTIFHQPGYASYINLPVILNKSI